LLVKVGALVFIIFLPTKLVINFQLLSNIWIIQTLPAIFIGLYTNWFHRQALIVGLLGGLASGTMMVITQNFQSSIYTFQLGGITLPVYAAVAALLLNLLLCVTLTPMLHGLGIASGEDRTTPADFQTRPVPGLRPQPSAPSPSQKLSRAGATARR
jgi:SSS family solute:Na+ symporter